MLLYLQVRKQKNNLRSVMITKWGISNFFDWVENNLSSYYDYNQGESALDSERGIYFEAVPYISFLDNTQRNKEDNFYYIYWIDNMPVGFIKMVQNGIGRSYITVHKDYRNQGVATALLLHCKRNHPDCLFTQYSVDGKQYLERLNMSLWPDSSPTHF